MSDSPAAVRIPADSVPLEGLLERVSLAPLLAEAICRLNGNPP